jgi:hypothetical protein
MYKLAAAGNLVLEKRDFFISYNPHPIGGGPETALVSRHPVKYYILEGDFMEEYEGLADKGFQACLEFFRGKPELRSDWSTGE